MYVVRRLIPLFMGDRRTPLSIQQLRIFSVNIKLCEIFILKAAPKTLLEDRGRNQAL